MNLFPVFASMLMNAELPSPNPNISKQVAGPRFVLAVRIWGLQILQPVPLHFSQNTFVGRDI